VASSQRSGYQSLEGQVKAAVSSEERGKKDFWENARFFACFLSVILLTVFAANVNFGPRGNAIAIGICATLRSGLIAYFMASLFKGYSLIFRTFFFTVIFFIGMVFLSLWDSPLPTIGNPISLPPPHHVP